MDIREKLVELLRKGSILGTGVTYAEMADYLLANGVTVQGYACWEQILDCGIGRCYGRCSSCRTQHKANSYGELMTEHRYCRWCGARLLYEPPKGE